MSRRPGPVCERESLACPGAAATLDGDDAAAREHAAHGQGFDWITLQRHGRRPLAILGRVLLHGDNRCAGLRWWSSITVHETSSGRFVVSLCHAASFETGLPWRDAWAHDSAAELRDALRRHDPVSTLPSGTMAASRSGDGTGRDAALFDIVPDGESLRWEPADWRFRAAWAGLLSALFGLPAVGPPRAVAKSLATP